MAVFTWMLSVIFLILRTQRQMCNYFAQFVHLDGMLNVQFLSEIQSSCFPDVELRLWSVRSVHMVVCLE